MTLREYRIIGPPGTGKTSWLATQVGRVVERKGPDSVLITSFTRAAAKEALGRDLPIADERVGTLHALCYRALGRPTIAESKAAEWNAAYPALSLTKVKGTLDEPSGEVEGTGAGDDLLMECNRQRARMIPKAYWTDQSRAFWAMWQDWKVQNSYADFTDLLEIGLQELVTPPLGADVLMIDEAQDMTSLQFALVRQWGESCEYLYVVGDGDQCLPACETVRTLTREKRIGDLVEGEIIDTSMGVIGMGRSYVEKITRRLVSEELYEIVTEHGSFRCTGEHHVPAKWPGTKTGWHYVYLERDMRDRWRIGITQNPRLRLRFERDVEGLLPIMAFDSREEAAVYEVALACKYGVPQILFAPRGGGGEEMSQEALDATFALLDTADGAQRLLAALGKRWEGFVYKEATLQGQTQRKLVYLDALSNHDGRKSPFLVRHESGPVRLRKTIPTLRKARAEAKRFRLPIVERWFFVNKHPMEMLPAMNLLPGMLTATEKNGKAILSRIIAVNRVPYCGEVVDIEVAGTHNFVLSSGQIVGNCLYDWLGASVDNMMEPVTDEKVLDYSYRCPETVVATATRWIQQASKRNPTVYRPRDGGPGYVRHEHHVTWQHAEGLLDYVTQKAAAGETVMILGSCSYMLHPIITLLRSEGLAYHNPYRATRGDWNPLRGGHGTSMVDRMQAFLRPSSKLFGAGARFWTQEDVYQFTDVMRSGGGLKRGAKSLLAGIPQPDRVATEADITWLLENVFEEQAMARAFDLDLDWWVESLLPAKRKIVDYPVQVFKRHGWVALRDTPNIITGTIHCSPPDEPVLTTLGWKAISDLNPETDRLLSYDSKSTRLVRGRNRKGMKGAGYVFKLAHRPYSGAMIHLHTERSYTRVTPEHRLRVKYADQFYNKWIVYLMRRGDWWRCGICTSGHIPYYSGGLGGRMSTEQADAGWILGVYETRKDALIAEATVQGEYGIPSLTFEVARGRALSTRDVQAVHDSTAKEANVRARRLLESFGLLEDAPLHTRNNRVRITYSFETVAANFLPGYMLLPTADESDYALPGHPSPQWLDVTRWDEEYDGEVYSLSVTPYEHYISGGAVVHNSVKGGEAAHVVLFPDLSPAGFRQWQAVGPGRDAVLRQFYVGLTRAREGVTICAPAGAMSVPLWREG